MNKEVDAAAVVSLITDLANWLPIVVGYIAGALLLVVGTASLISSPELVDLVYFTGSLLSIVTAKQVIGDK